MLGLVNYGASDSEDEISDEEVEAAKPTNGISKISENIENDFTISSRIKLPQPKQNQVDLQEEDDEFLHKKATPSIPPPPKKEKVKIYIPKLSDFKDDDDDDEIRKVKVPFGQKKIGLLGMLPKPSNSFAPAPKPKPVQIPANIPRKPQATVTSSSDEPGPSTAITDPVPKKVGFIPYKLMAHAQKTDDKKKKKDESDSDDEDDPTSFFSFASNDELPKVNDAEVRALVDKEQFRMEERKRQHEESQAEALAQEAAYYQQQQDVYEQNETQIDEEAMRALLGGNKAKRMKTDNIEILDLNADQVMPNREEWLRRSLAGETEFIASGKINEKVRSYFNHTSLDTMLKYYNFNFRAQMHCRNENIKSHTYPCVPKTTCKSSKLCGQPTDRQPNKDATNMDFKLKSMSKLFRDCKSFSKQINFQIFKIFFDAKFSSFVYTKTHVPSLV